VACSDEPVKSQSPGEALDWKLGLAIEEANLKDLGRGTTSLRKALSAHARNQSLLLDSSNRLFAAQRPELRLALRHRGYRPR
jgi:hypothetical protein